jgi:CRP-like cAMP-binding protein
VTGGRWLVAKLSKLVPFSTDEIRLLESLCANEQRFDAGATVVGEGELLQSGFVLTAGMACRYRLLPDGRRQILTFLIPGDFCDLHVFLTNAMDHSIDTIVASRLAWIARETVIHLVGHHPRISAALWWSAMQEAAMLRERVVAVGRRNARGRVAYLLCELVWRQRAIGMTAGNSIPLPLTQPQLGDTLGLTPVHMNRILQQFRRDGLVRLKQRQLALLDIGRLMEIAAFDGSYLHLGGAPEDTQRLFDRLDRERPPAVQGTPGTV